MAPLANGRLLFNEPPSGLPEPGKTTVYDESEVIDLDSVLVKGGVLLKVLVLSVDPYMRNRMRDPAKKSYNTPFTIGEPLVNFGVGVVLRSEDATVKKGDHLYGFLPFQKYVVLENPRDFKVLENKEKLPWSVYVGVCGMPGETAYYAWKEYAKSQKGDVVYVSTASGAVGAVVVQLAKADGLKVIASSGSDEKVAFASEIGADVSFNYKTVNMAKVLENEGPINIYWDNVGGSTLEAALDAAASGARFIECGMISGYNNEPHFIKNLMHIIGKQLHIHGFVVGSLRPKYQEEFYSTFPARVASGEIKYKEYLVSGLENAGQAILDVQTGVNFGKCTVIVAEE